MQFKAVNLASITPEEAAVIVAFLSRIEREAVLAAMSTQERGKPVTQLTYHRCTPRCNPLTRSIYSAQLTTLSRSTLLLYSTHLVCSGVILSQLSVSLPEVYSEFPLELRIQMMPAMSKLAVCATLRAMPLQDKITAILAIDSDMRTVALAAMSPQEREAIFNILTSEQRAIALSGEAAAFAGK